MFVKFVAFLAFVAVASASADLSSFAYEVADPYTGDFKNQAETRLGNDVRGQYSLLESDGTRRTVDYAAGAEGFNAVVRKDPAFIATPVLQHAAPIIAARALPYSALPYSALPYSALSYSGLPINNYNFAKFANYGLAPYAYAKYF